MYDRRKSDSLIFTIYIKFIPSWWKFREDDSREGRLKIIAAITSRNFLTFAIVHEIDNFHWQLGGVPTVWGAMFKSTIRKFYNCKIKGTLKPLFGIFPFFVNNVLTKYEKYQIYTWRNVNFFTYYFITLLPVSFTPYSLPRCAASTGKHPVSNCRSFNSISPIYVDVLQF